MVRYLAAGCAANASFLRDGVAVSSRECITASRPEHLCCAILGCSTAKDFGDLTWLRLGGRRTQVGLSPCGRSPVVLARHGLCVFLLAHACLRARCLSCTAYEADNAKWFFSLKESDSCLNQIDR